LFFIQGSNKNLGWKLYEIPLQKYTSPVTKVD
jgi:hypothetical protein